MSGNDTLCRGEAAGSLLRAEHHTPGTQQVHAGLARPGTERRHGHASAGDPAAASPRRLTVDSATAPSLVVEEPRSRRTCRTTRPREGDVLAGAEVWTRLENSAVR